MAQHSLVDLPVNLHELLEFETLLSEVSARFVNLPFDRVDSAIEESQRTICECLGVDHSSVWQASSNEPGILLLTHLFRDPTLPSPPERMDGESYFPWTQLRLRNKEIVNVPSTLHVPAEAATDSNTWQAYGIKSALGFPLYVGDGPVFGVLAFDATTRERDWPLALVKRLQLLAQVFANALARKHTEQALKDSEARLRLAAASASAGLWTLDLALGHIWATEKTREILGFTPAEELDVSKFMFAVYPEDRDAVQRAIDDAVISGEERCIEYRIMRPDGQTRWILARGRLHRGESGLPNLLMGVSIDVTERKQIQQALDTSNEQLARIVSSAMDAIIAIDGQQRVVVFNLAAEKAFGCSADDAIGRPIDRFIPQRFLVVDSEHIRVFNETGVTNRSMGALGSLWALRANGEEFPIEASISQSVVGGKKLFTLIIRDVTESKRNQEELQKSYAEVKHLKERLQAESNYLQKEIEDIGRYEEIIGQSEALRKVLRSVEQVASTDAVVLITGETGTGKERIARALHRLSRRKERAMVKVDCAALPPTLIESELFGREKGAYTGALTRQIGRFETADGSTLFLDEIGELGVEVQAKLLRIVQDGDFERLGSAKTTRVNVRLIAATHRDLAERVKNGSFRDDLFYRLNVFPIRVPPLRERLEDIPLLVRAFVREFEGKMSKKIGIIPRRAMEELQRYSWPGNIRELRNIIEHAVIVTTGEKLNLQMPKPVSVASMRTLREAEYQHILSALEKTGWRIKGPSGAATLLGMNSSTLYTAMRRLQIPTRREKGGIPS